MYLRVTQRRNKGGDVVRYLQLAHNERNERGVPVARVIYTFGREDEVDRDALARLVASISRFLEPEAALAAGAPAGFDFLEAREQGRPHVVGALWSELGIGRALARVAGSRRYRREVEREVFAIVCQRTIAPASKLEATRSAPREVVLPGVGELSDDGLYSAMDFLHAVLRELQERVFFMVATCLTSRSTCLFFDYPANLSDDEPSDDGGDEFSDEPALGVESSSATARCRSRLCRAGGAELFFVAADLGGERLEGLLELVDLGGERGQRERLAGRVAVLVDQLAQLALAVEGGAADPRALGDLGEGDALPGAQQLGTRLANGLQLAGGVLAHALSARVWSISCSRRAIRRRCRSASSPQPRCSASLASSSASLRCAESTGRNAASVRKFGQCSQTLV